MLVLVPVKRFSQGKTRLARLLSAAQRAELTCRMLADVLDAVSHVSCVQKIIVLSNETGIDSILRKYGLKRENDAELGNVNDNLMEAAHRVSDEGHYQNLLILSADVPTVGAEDIDVLDTTFRGGVTFCPATVDGGTNAILTSTPLRIPLQFGYDSLVRHQRSAIKAGISADVLFRDRLARDIDRPSDLVWLAASSYRGYAQAFAKEFYNSQEGRMAG